MTRLQRFFARPDEAGSARRASRKAARRASMNANQPANTQSANVQSTMIEELNQKFLDAFKTRNFAAIAEMFTDDAVMLPPRRNMITGRGNIESFWTQAARIKDLRFDTASFATLGGDAAREIGTFRMLVGPGRKRQAQEDDGDGDDSPVDVQANAIAGKYVFVWRKVGGHWKVETGMWNATKQKGRRGRGKRRRGRE
jgi:uncharacterized protein (TIGR02246 family)